MTPERWAQIEEIIQAALDYPVAQRAAYVEKCCGDDLDLRTAVKNLIRQHEANSSFLESPVWSNSLFLQTTLKNNVAALLADEFENSAAKDSRVGEIIAAYRLNEEIGRGGMGIVYAAARTEDFRQKVAVKIVKRGMDTDFILRRFRQERQILAALDHPHIARLLDGGATGDGRPYLVMEYVAGIPVDKFCDQQKLTIEARLMLFQKICRAVAYSHQRLIIHRDIKPSNILVTDDGTPKLLDFGIAKLLDATLAADSYQPTAAEARMMTPDYASPEQLRGETVTTTSDVYSLGVLLYLLLTGHLPFEYAVQPDAFARLVAERTPEKPSRLLTREDKATAKSADRQTHRQRLQTVAANRRTEPERLRRHLADDLDNIVLKALHKDQARRYSSVEQFAEDIARHLENLPVQARGDDFVYKTRKFAQRNRKSLIAAVLFFAVLFGGSALVAWQAHVAQRERARAENRFAESRRLTESLMFELHDAIRDLPGATRARELLAKRTLEHLDGLALEAADDTVLQSELTIAYVNLGNIQGNPYYANLGDASGALGSYCKAEKLAESLAAADPANASLARRLWLTQIRIADVLAAQGDTDAARETYVRAARLIERLAAADPANAALRTDSATSFDRQGNLAIRAKNYSAALASFRRALEIFEQASNEQPDEDAARRAVGAMNGKIGTTYLRLNEPEKALPYKEKLLRINQARLAREPANAATLDDVGSSWRELGDAQTALGRYAAASESYRRQAKIYRDLVAADPANVKPAVESAISHQSIGILQTRTGNLKAALKSHETALRTLFELAAKNPLNALVANQLPAAYYYLGETHTALTAAAGFSPARKNFHRRAAQSFFRQSLTAYFALPPGSVVLPPQINSPADFENLLRNKSGGDDNSID